MRSRIRANRPIDNDPVWRTVMLGQEEDKWAHLLLKYGSMGPHTNCYLAVRVSHGKRERVRLNMIRCVGQNTCVAVTHSRSNRSTSPTNRDPGAFINGPDSSLENQRTRFQSGALDHDNEEGGSPCDLSPLPPSMLSLWIWHGMSLRTEYNY
ncbi:hypothetical protein Nepgr_022709 [Nepenthes gracilis]|uniref:Uncharacterized protein n=1 Tax=Nepenthes gracilis TaxID=150966 RepID=A0AAD3T2K4_NEPGR|nr:hypothetical protein Nepgr_022709 [Nepenthes gracilis]